MASEQQLLRGRIKLLNLAQQVGVSQLCAKLDCAQGSYRRLRQLWIATGEAIRAFLLDHVGPTSSCNASDVSETRRDAFITEKG